MTYPYVYDIVYKYIFFNFFFLMPRENQNKASDEPVDFG